jgi:mannose-6-phosphate isomerase
MTLDFNSNTPKETVLKNVELYLKEQKIHISKQDSQRPWGGFFVIDESNADSFISLFFPHFSKKQLAISGKLSPKILMVAPQKRLSWQYHHRRAEIWKLIAGEASVVVSDDDTEKEIKKLLIGDIIELHNGERHRLVGLDNWGIIAEIWRHTDAANPSDEDDIIRLQDDYGR